VRGLGIGCCYSTRLKNRVSGQPSRYDLARFIERPAGLGLVTVSCGAVLMPGSMREDSMAHLEAPQFRLAGPADARTIADLHAESWRRHYRGAYSDTVFDDDPTWGALLDNLHVADGHKRRHIGSRLLALTAEAVMERPQRTGLYLWVLEQNVDAQAFYQARGALCVGRDLVSSPGGVAGRLTGSPVKLRYAWPEPTVLLGQR
jgi:ribosomal protein S18 acetylase RimI-like enzyme